MQYNYKDWELFSCDIKDPKDDDDCSEYVDMLSIDSKRKRYILDVHCDERNTDGCHEDGTDVICTCLSRELLYILLDGLKRNGYKEYVEKEEQ